MRCDSWAPLFNLCIWFKSAKVRERERKRDNIFGVLCVRTRVLSTLFPLFPSAVDSTRFRCYLMPTKKIQSFFFSSLHVFAYSRFPIDIVNVVLHKYFYVSKMGKQTTKVDENVQRKNKKHHFSHYSLYIYFSIFDRDIPNWFVFAYWTRQRKSGVYREMKIWMQQS